MSLHLQFTMYTKLFVYYLIFIPKRRSCRPLSCFLNAVKEIYENISLVNLHHNILKYFETYFKVTFSK